MLPQEYGRVYPRILYCVTTRSPLTAYSVIVHYHFTPVRVNEFIVNIITTFTELGIEPRSNPSRFAFPFGYSVTLAMPLRDNTAILLRGTDSHCLAAGIGLHPTFVGFLNLTLSELSGASPHLTYLRL